MSEINNRKLTVLSVLVGVLVVADVAQSVIMFGLHRRVQKSPLVEESSSLGVIQNDDDNRLTRSLLPTDPFDDDPFDWGTNDWDPFKEMHSMHDRINQMFGSAFNRFEDSDSFGGLFGDYSFSPDINMEDKGDHYLVTVDLPGVEDSRLDVKIDGRILTISGTMKTESEEKDIGTMMRQERRSGSFQRIVTLPSLVKAEKMKTKAKKGVIHIEIPKADE